MSAAMLTQSAVTFFKSRAEIARRLRGSRSQSAVYQWGEVVPLGAARRLETISNRELLVDESLYDELGRVIRKNEAAA